MHVSVHFCLCFFVYLYVIVRLSLFGLIVFMHETCVNACARIEPLSRACACAGAVHLLLETQYRLV